MFVLKFKKGIIQRHSNINLDILILINLLYETSRVFFPHNSLLFCMILPTALMLSLPTLEPPIFSKKQCFPCSEWSSFPVHYTPHKHTHTSSYNTGQILQPKEVYQYPTKPPVRTFNTKSQKQHSVFSCL